MDTDFEGFTLEQLLEIVPPGVSLARRQDGDSRSTEWRATCPAFGITADDDRPGGALAGLLRAVYGRIATLNREPSPSDLEAQRRMAG